MEPSGIINEKGWTKMGLPFNDRPVLILGPPTCGSPSKPTVTLLPWLTELLANGLGLNTTVRGQAPWPGLAGGRQVGTNREKFLLLYCSTTGKANSPPLWEYDKSEACRNRFWLLRPT